MENSKRKMNPRLLMGFGLVVLILVIADVIQLVSVWRQSSAGVKDQYPHEHQMLMLGAITNLVLVPVIVFPLLLPNLDERPRVVRYSGYVAWAGMMVAASILIAYQTRLLHGR